MQAHVSQRDVSIALLYQAQALHEHLKQALTELGASVVYDSPAANFDRAALSRSGARVVVVNLDPEVGDDIDQLDELLADDDLRVIFNDGEVSSRLEGWDQARWARHLAAKILGVDDTNPPRPQGAEAIPVRVKSSAPAPAPDDFTPAGLSFELEGDELDRALNADTGEAITRTRAALVTKDEPIAVQLVDPHARKADASAAPNLDLEPIDAPANDPRATVVLPRVKMEDAVRLAQADAAQARGEFIRSDERPTLELDIADLQAATPVATPAAADNFDELSLDFDLGDAPTIDAGASTLEDISLEGEAVAGTDDGLSLADDGTLELSTAEAAVNATPEQAANDLDDALRDFGFLDEPAAAPSAPEAAPMTAASDDFSLDFDGGGELVLDSTLDAPTANLNADVGEIALTEDFDIALGALNLEPIEDEPSAPQRDAAPPPGLDELLMNAQLGGRPEDDKLASKPAGGRPAQAKITTPAAAKPAAPVTAKPVATPAKPAAAPSAEAAKPAQRSLSDFNLSHLSLAPVEDGEAPAPAADGRAKFAVGDTPAPAKPAAKPAAPPPPTVPDDSGFSLEAMDFELEADAKPVVTRGGAESMVTPEVGGENDLMAELDALSAKAEVAASAEGGVLQRVWVLGASIGGPEAVREFLGAIPANAPVLFLLAQHMGADFLDLMIQQLSRATPLTVRSVANGETVRHGEVVVVPLGERLLIDPNGGVRVTALDQPSAYSPSIDQVMCDVADRFGDRAGAIIFSGMAHDAIDGAQYLHERGGKVWVQDPATCVISSMVDGAREAGVVSQEGAPAELARQFVKQILRG